MATPIPSNQAAFALDEVAAITGGERVGAPASIRGVCTDSRTLAAGQLFVALRGESFDGHRFVPDAVRAGAAVLVSSRDALPADASAVVVPDTLVALGALGRAHRRRWGRTLVGITGSAGKTTTKELTRAALEGAGRAVHATRGNLNNRIGVPMTLLELDASHDVAVVEMGTSETGEIAALAAIAEPDLAVITSIGLSHAAGIGDVDAVAHEKGALFRALGGEGIAIVQADDPRVVAALPAGARRITYGLAEGADFRIVDGTLEEGGARARLVTPGATLALALPIPSLVALTNAAGAIAIVSALGGDLAGAVSALATAAAVPGRMRPLPLRSGALVVDDTYNANPRSMQASIESAAAMARSRGGRLLLVLGEMKELGAHAEEAHVALARLAADAEVARFVGVGAAMGAAVSAAAALGIDARHLDDAALAPAELRDLGGRDVVLVKGSRSMRMERAVEALATTEEAS